MSKWICVDCGHEHEGEEAPEFCPVCGSSDFEKESNNE